MWVAERLDNAMSEGLLTRILVFNLVRFSSLCLACGIAYLLVVAAVQHTILVLASSTALVLAITAHACVHDAFKVKGRGKGYGRAICSTAAQSPGEQFARAAALLLPRILIPLLLLFEAGLWQCHLFVVGQPRVKRLLLLISKSSKPVISPLTRVFRLCSHTMLYLCQQAMARAVLSLTTDTTTNSNSSNNSSNQRNTTTAQFECNNLTLEELPFDVLQSHLRLVLDATALVRLSACSTRLYRLIHSLPCPPLNTVSDFVLLSTTSRHWRQGFAAWRRTLPILLPWSSLAPRNHINSNFFHQLPGEAPQAGQRNNDRNGLGSDPERWRSKTIVPHDLYTLAAGVYIGQGGLSQDLEGLNKIQPFVIVCRDSVVSERFVSGACAQSVRLEFEDCSTAAGYQFDVRTLPQLQHLTVTASGPHPENKFQLCPRGLHELPHLHICLPTALAPNAFGPHNRHVTLEHVSSADLRGLQHARHVALFGVAGLAKLHCLHSATHVELHNLRHTSDHEPFPVLPGLDSLVVSKPPAWLLPSLAPLAHVRHVTITATVWIRDLSPLSGADTVVLRKCPNVVDVAPLRHVHTVALDRCQNIRDYAALSGVRVLRLCRMDAARLAALASTALRELHLIALENMQAFPTTPGLRVLRVSSCHHVGTVPIPQHLHTLHIHDCNGVWNLLHAARVASLHVTNADALVPGPLMRFVQQQRHALSLLES